MGRVTAPESRWKRMGIVEVAAVGAGSGEVAAVGGGGGYASIVKQPFWERGTLKLCVTIN